MKWRSYSPAYTLLEILLVLALGAILTAVSLPAFSGWWNEHQLRTQAGVFIDAVQAAKISADQTGRAQTIVFTAPNERLPQPLPPDTRFFQAGGPAQWSFHSFDGAENQVSLRAMEVDRHGLVDPLIFRVQDGSSFVEYRFDVLTGHAVEERSSF